MDHTYKLTKMANKGGWDAKKGQGVLSELLEHLPKMEDPNMLLGFESSDDAAIYKVNDSQAVIQTVDFFPPMVDDPYLFGQVAAANALSDVYAMGGTPVMAMNLLTFPSCMDPECVQKILKGGYEKVLEAGAVIGGGHTIDDQEPKYGLSVMGMVHPKEFWRNDTAEEGDLLILTKPVGNGIYNLAARAEFLTDKQEEEAAYWMTLLNKSAKEALERKEVHACTDITGFGLLGHTLEMARGSKKSFHLNLEQIPFLTDAVEMAADGFVPAGAYQNEEFLRDYICYVGEIDEAYKDVMRDPQTSGGLLAALPLKDAEEAVREMGEKGIFAKIIGYVTEAEAYSVYVHG